MPMHWVANLECTESELRSLHRELESAIAASRRVMEQLKTIDGETAARGVERYQEIIDDLTRVRGRVGVLLEEVGNEERGWRLVEEGN
jgi:hypothetical protein